MNKSLKVILCVVIVALIVGAVYFFTADPGPTEPQGVLVSDSFLDKLTTTYPDLTSYVEEIRAEQKKFFETEEVSATPYLSLGLTWKSLADRTRESEHYAQALLIYEEGAEKIGRNNTVLLSNAGSMAVYIGDYELGEKYYLESLRVAPGDTKAYIALAEIYEYNLGKPIDEIVALLDTGIETAIPPTDLVNYKRALLERHP